MADLRPATAAYGVYNVADLADYEACRARLRCDPAAEANFAFAREQRFILKEDRIFLRLVSDT